VQHILLKSEEEEEEALHASWNHAKTAGLNQNKPHVTGRRCYYFAHLMEFRDVEFLLLLLVKGHASIT
jgi:hypothetical protein